MRRVVVIYHLIYKTELMVLDGNGKRLVFVHENVLLLLVPSASALPLVSEDGHEEVKDEHDHQDLDEQRVRIRIIDAVWLRQVDRVLVSHIYGGGRLQGIFKCCIGCSISDGGNGWFGRACNGLKGCLGKKVKVVIIQLAQQRDNSGCLGN